MWSFYGYKKIIITMFPTDLDNSDLPSGSPVFWGLSAHFTKKKRGKERERGAKEKIQVHILLPTLQIRSKGRNRHSPEDMSSGHLPYFSGSAWTRHLPPKVLSCLVVKKEEAKINQQQNSWHSPWSERGSGQIQRVRSFSILWTQYTSLFLHRTYHFPDGHKTGPLQLSENMHKNTELTYKIKRDHTDQD